MRIFFAFLLLSLSFFCSAQTEELPCYDLAQIKTVDTINNAVLAVMSRQVNITREFPSITFTKKNPYRRNMPPKVVTKKFLFGFNVRNSSGDTASAGFYPSTFYEKINLYRKQGDSLILLPKIYLNHPDSAGYPIFKLAPNDTATIYAELFPLKTYTNIIWPKLVNIHFLPFYIRSMIYSKMGLDKMTYIFSGLLLMMIIFSLANYATGANNEFLLYAGYALFIGVMLFSKCYFFLQTNPVSYFFESYFDFILQGSGIIFYMLFMQRFLNTKQKYKFLYRFYNFGIIFLGLALIAYTYFHYFTSSFLPENNIETLSKVVLLVMLVVFIAYSITKKNDRSLMFVTWGNIALFIFAIYSQLLIIFKWEIEWLPDILNDSLFYYEMGVFLEMVFFLMGLSYKNRRNIIEQTKEKERLKIENERKESEKQMAIVTAQQEERNRISVDMHDELGAGMTAIRLMSEIAKKKMRENIPVELERISQSADDVLNKMNAIIWSMNSKNDSLDNLISYIRTYALEYFENTSIACTVTIPPEIENKEVLGEKRRNLFLCVKETLNNILKHAKATAVTIHIEANHQLLIQIHNNGVGIDLQRLRQFGNGLQNIERRMVAIGGSFKIERFNGTQTTLALPL